MISLVLDASVIMKWILSDHANEPDTGKALDILQAMNDGHITLQEPPHWLAETAAVVSRLSPKVAHESVGLLYAMEISVLNGPEIYQRACDLAIELQQHLFDTLYHAVAFCQPDTILITADDRYYRKASKVGRILRLRDYRLEDVIA
ncbi:type II toxin-antitoxin system VapC family toxin [Nitrospira sp. M1]